MTRILCIDDEPLYPKMVAHAVRSLGYQVDTAEDGEQGLAAALANPPDLIISDVMMPKMSGYEVTRRIRRDPRFANVPIMMLTAQAELGDKLEAFEAGADDHMTKPFAPPELVARITVLLRRSETIKEQQPQTRETRAHIIAVHSLRGGTGCSSMAVNLALGLCGLWNTPTLLMDIVLTAGQVALMLNASLKRTWADITHVKADELDMEIIQSVIGKHETNLQFLAAPTYPSDAELLTDEFFAAAFKLLVTQYEYLVVDLPHDFGGMTLQALDAADRIVVMMAPEMASVRAAAAALDTYRKLGYPDEKLKLVLNWTFERKGLARKNIEAALRHPLDLVIPFAPDLFVEAINLGRPLLQSRANESLADALETFAFQLSKADHRNNVPPAPSGAWQRLNRRMRA